MIALYFYYIRYIDYENVNKILEKSKELYKIHLDYPLDENEKQKLWEKQYVTFTENLDSEAIFNPPIGFDEFKQKIENA